MMSFTTYKYIIVPILRSGVENNIFFDLIIFLPVFAVFFYCMYSIKFWYEIPILSAVFIVIGKIYTYFLSISLQPGFLKSTAKEDPQGFWMSGTLTMFVVVNVVLFIIWYLVKVFHKK